MTYTQILSIKYFTLAQDTYYVSAVGAGGGGKQGVSHDQRGIADSRGQGDRGRPLRERNA